MRTLWIFVATGLLVAVATTTHFAERYATDESMANSIAPLAIPASLYQSDEADPEVKLVLLALRPEGFDSSEMRLDPGDYLFIVGNRTGLKEVNLRLDREGNGRIASATAGGRQRDWKTRLKLTTGSYVLTVDQNPDWTCRITVAQ